MYLYSYFSVVVITVAVIIVMIITNIIIVGILIISTALTTDGPANHWLSMPLAVR